MRQTQQILEIARSGILDRQWYCDTYRDVAIAGVDPVQHYALMGWREGRDPSPLFSTDFYLSQVPELRDSGVNPLAHYVTKGWRQGLTPRPGYRPSAAARLLSDECPLVVDLYSARQESEAPRQVSPRRWPDVASKHDSPATEPPGATPIRPVAFYLPQFHAIPENDEAWGEGFTEWTNVRRGRSRFAGHQQPKVPGDLGYYRLPGPDGGPDQVLTFRQQIALARRHGISAFCFYTYWFDGHELLQSPLEAWLADPSLDFPFCLCWANENWTRTWDGSDSEIIVAQRHSEADDIRFIERYSGALSDPRYLRVGGRPVLVVFRPELLPDPAATARRWREWCRDHGVGEILLASTLSFVHRDPREFGFDYAIEFPPNSASPLNITDDMETEPGFRGTIYDGKELSQRSHHLPPPLFPTWRGVTPAWDNEPRRPNEGMTLHGCTPETFQRWLLNVGRDTRQRVRNDDDRLVFVNAWNEWAEGAYLEPDEEFGYGWLHAVRDTQEEIAGITEGTGPGVLVVTHDLQRHGAQFGALALVRELIRLGRRTRTVALGGGTLHRSFEREAPVDLLESREPADARKLAEELAEAGFTTALCSSSASGWLVPYLRDAGIHVTGLVHELPGAIDELGIAAAAEAMAENSDRIVFPAEHVRQRFPFALAAGCEVIVRPQGLYQRPSSRPLKDSLEVRTRLEIAAGSPIVLGVGYGSRNKGIDRFVALARELPYDEKGNEVHYLWIGDLDWSDEALAAELSDAPANCHLLGFVQTTAPFYAAASVLAITSREDSFPSVALEGLAAGLGVVAFEDATGLNHIIADTSGQLVATEAGIAGLAAAVAQALSAGPQPAAGRAAYVNRFFNYQDYVLDLLAGTSAAIPRITAVLPPVADDVQRAELLDAVTASEHPLYEIVVVGASSSGGGGLRRGDRPLGAAIREVEADLFVREGACGDLVWIVGTEFSPGPDVASQLVQPLMSERRVRASALIADTADSWPFGRRTWVTGAALEEHLAAPGFPAPTGDVVIDRDLLAKVTLSGQDPLGDVVAGLGEALVALVPVSRTVLNP